MNGQTFRRVIGCIPNITSSMACSAGQKEKCLTQHLLEKDRAMLQKIKSSAYERLSCRKALKHLGPWDLSVLFF